MCSTNEGERERDCKAKTTNAKTDQLRKKTGKALVRKRDNDIGRRLNHEELRENQAEKKCEPSQDRAAIVADVIFKVVLVIGRALEELNERSASCCLTLPSSESS